MSLSDKLVRYLERATLEDFLELRREVASCPNYAPYDSYEAKANGPLREGKYQAAIEILRAMMPGWLLSPGLHSTLAYAHDKQGQTEDAEREAYLAAAVLDGILKTGDGSQERPYLVLQISDEYEVLHHLQKKPLRQAAISQGDRALDQQACEDGSAVWFDVTTLRHGGRQQ
jgi:hypothetical protein